MWEGHLLRGAVEMLAGVPGVGKSQVQCHYIACATNRLVWPNGAPPIDPVNVVMITAEDTLDQEVVPRAARCRRRREACLHPERHQGQKGREDRPAVLARRGLVQLELEVARIGNVGLVTIDPITAYMGGKIDSHKVTEVRSQLGPLKDFAERTSIAVSVVTHPAKSAGPKAINHFIGSQAFVAAARIGHLCVEELAEEEGDEEGKTEMVPTGRVLFTHPKHNPSIELPTLAYRVVADVCVGQDPKSDKNIFPPRVVWDTSTVDVTADEAVAAAVAKS